MYKDLTVEKFSEDLASKAPVPGGGGAAALCGALGIALGAMVANLTVGKPKYAEVDAEMRLRLADGDRLRAELIALIDRDAEGFAPCAASYALPQTTEEEREKKRVALQAALKTASLAPFEMMRKCGEAIELLEYFAKNGSRLVISDAGCGAALCKAAMQAAWLNVRINTGMIEDPDFKGQMEAEGTALLQKYLPMADVVYAEVEEAIRK